MSTVKTILLSAFHTTAQTMLKLSKIIIPTMFVLTIIKSTVIIDWIANSFAPIMSIFNLPGEASIALIAGNIVNLYAAIATIQTLHLEAYQVTILASMLLISHSLFVETAVAASVCDKKYLSPILRITISILVGISLGIIYGVIYG